MDHAAVLHVRALADAQQLRVATQDRAEPHARAFAEFDVADHLRAVGDPGGVGQAGRVFVELVEGHAATCAVKPIILG